MTPYFAKDVPTSVAVPLELENKIYMKWLRNKSFVSERFTPALTDKLFQLFSEGKISKKPCVRLRRQSIRMIFSKRNLLRQSGESYGNCIKLEKSQKMFCQG